jgi:hypothetical protein
VNAAVPAHHAIAWNHELIHPEVLAAVRDQLVDFFERARIEQVSHALARGQLALVMLLLEPLLPATELGESLTLAKPFNRIHISRPRRGCPGCRSPAP